MNEKVTLTDEEIANAMMFMLEREKMLVEAVRADALAAILYKKVPIAQKNVGCIISCGNADENKKQLYKDLSTKAMKLYHTS